MRAVLPPVMDPAFQHQAFYLEKPYLVVWVEEVNGRQDYSLTCKSKTAFLIMWLSLSLYRSLVWTKLLSQLYWFFQPKEVLYIWIASTVINNWHVGSVSFGTIFMNSSMTPRFELFAGFYNAEGLTFVVYGTGLYHFRAALGEFDTFNDTSGYFTVRRSNPVIVHLNFGFIFLCKGLLWRIWNGWLFIHALLFWSRDDVLPTHAVWIPACAQKTRRPYPNARDCRWWESQKSVSLKLPHPPALTCSIFVWKQTFLCFFLVEWSIIRKGKGASLRLFKFIRFI